MFSKNWALIFTTILMTVNPVNASDTFVDSQKQVTKSWNFLIDNLNYPQAPLGTIIASPSSNAPNYLYHWVRDAGIVAREVIQLYKNTQDPILKQEINTFIKSWIEVESQHQLLTERKSAYGFGEPLFTLAGELYPHDWGRPQRDGPAIRALAMIEWTKILLSEQRNIEVRELYVAEFPATRIIKKDLEYVAHNWTFQGFDLWEEVNAFHFFTLMVQRAALIQGADLAIKLNDPKAASFYLEEVRKIEALLIKFYDKERGFVKASIEQIGGWRHKISNLDIAPVLGSIYFSQNDGFMTPDSEPIVRTAMKLIDTFNDIYEINKNSNLAPAIGRYPEDVYNGSGFSEGNPWFIATNAIAEWACDYKHSEKFIAVGNTLFSGMDFIQSALTHTDVDGRFSEQFGRYDGKMIGAVDLSWSYSSYIRAYKACANGDALLISPTKSFLENKSGQTK
jgi:glucoamylase